MANFGEKLRRLATTKINRDVSFKFDYTQKLGILVKDNEKEIIHDASISEYVTRYKMFHSEDPTECERLKAAILKVNSIDGISFDYRPGYGWNQYIGCVVYAKWDGSDSVIEKYVDLGCD